MMFFRAITLIILCTLAGSANAASVDPFAGGKHKTSAPIEINADNLEVLQEENKAIFTGHVVAIQGDIRLKAEKMTVYYRKQEETNTKKPKSTDPAGQNAIRRIDVEGSVFLSTPEETASGASGVYDVENHQILLNDRVVLTRAKNTLKGERLVYDFNTGKSTLMSGDKVQTSGSKERVRALFVPENAKDKEQK